MSFKAHKAKRNSPLRGFSAANANKRPFEVIGAVENNESEVLLIKDGSLTSATKNSPRTDQIHNCVTFHFALPEKLVTKTENPTESREFRRNFGDPEDLST